MPCTARSAMLLAIAIATHARGERMIVTMDSSDLHSSGTRTDAEWFSCGRIGGEGRVRVLACDPELGGSGGTVYDCYAEACDLHRRTEIPTFDCARIGGTGEAEQLPCDCEAREARGADEECSLRQCYAYSCGLENEL